MKKPEKYWLVLVKYYVKLTGITILHTHPLRPTPSHSYSLSTTPTHSHPFRATLTHLCLCYYKCHVCISTHLYVFKHLIRNKEIMHNMSHVVNKLNGLSDFASVGTFYALLIESSDVYSEYDLQIMHFIAIILG